MAVVINGTTGITSVNGTAGAPSVTGTDTDTGIVYGTNTLSLATGGTTAVTVDSSQNVGIGTSSPSNKLVVSNAGANGFEFDPANALLQTYNRSGAAYVGMNLLASTIAFKTGSSPATSVLIDSSGNVGIGTSSPSEKLQVSGNILVGDGTNANYIEVRNGSNWTGRLAASAVGNLSQQYYNGSSWVNGTTLDSSGNFKFNSGYGSVATAYGCRAWVNFNGTGTVSIRASGNVSSITDNGVGDYTVNFTTAMPDANYCAVIGGYQTAGSSPVTLLKSGSPYATGSVSVICGNTASQIDSTYINVSILR